MLEVSETRSIAQRELSDPLRTPLDPSGPVRVDEEYVVWVYNTVEFWDSGDPLTSLAGNGPIAVSRRDGSVHHLPTAIPLDQAMTELRDGER